MRGDAACWPDSVRTDMCTEMYCIQTSVPTSVPDLDRLSKLRPAMPSYANCLCAWHSHVSAHVYACLRRSCCVAPVDDNSTMAAFEKKQSLIAKPLTDAERKQLCAGVLRGDSMYPRPSPLPVHHRTLLCAHAHTSER